MLPAVHAARLLASRPLASPTGSLLVSSVGGRMYSGGSGASDTIVYKMKPLTSATGPGAKPAVPTVFPRGFRVGGTAAGVKKNGKLDVALFVSQPEQPCAAAGVFTTNKFQAAPVLVSKKILQETGGYNVHAVVANAGCANACTGEQGLADAWTMSRSASQVTGAAHSLVLSTGVIGQKLPMDKLVPGIEATAAASNAASGRFGSDASAWKTVSEAIMTTDTFPKLLARQYALPDGAGSYVMAGVAKGAGMIHPNMATMLGVVCTDAPVSPEALSAATKFAADRSFNAISVDGDTSTNDTLLVLANGAAENCRVKIDSPASPHFDHFRSHLTEFCAELAKLIVRDGEGATKFVTVNIQNARSFDEAKTIASTIATSALVKTALFGEDANWGRILAAVGYSGIQVDPSKVHLYFEGAGDRLHLVKAGEPFDVDEVRAKKIITQPEVTITVDLGLGNQSATMWTCDFSYDYVKINGDYRT